MTLYSKSRVNGSSVLRLSLSAVAAYFSIYEGETLTNMGIRAMSYVNAPEL